MKPAGVIALAALLLFPLHVTVAAATSFLGADTTDLPPLAPSAPAFADFNRDGNLDLALTVSDGSNHFLRIMTGDGSGALTFSADLPTPAASGGMVAADLNGDGITDLALSNSADNSITVFLCNGDGSFQTRVDYSIGTAPKEIAAGDFRGDGTKDDIAVVNSTDNSVAILLNNGSGVMTVQGSGSWPTSTSSISGIAVGDFDDDGIDDIAVARTSEDVAMVFHGTGIGSFTAGSDVTVGDAPVALAATDLNSDGISDLAVANSLGATVSVFKGIRGAPLVASGTHSVTNPVAIVFGDFNRDGIDDIAVANGTNNSLSVLNGRGDATFAPAESFAADTAPSALAYGDLNGNGNDLLSVSITSLSYSLLLNNSAAAAGLSVSYGSYDFGNFQIGHMTYLSKLLNITNGGTAPLTISSMTISGTNSGDFQVTTQDGATCPSITPTLAPGSSCSVLMKFMNPITEGAKSASLNIASNAPIVPSMVIPMSGTGVSMATPYTIHLSFLGMGSGTVTFSTGEATCSTSCDRAALTEGVMELTPAPGSGSLLHGWTGCDSVLYGICTVNMGVNNGWDRTITINFGLVPRRVLLSSGMNVFSASVGGAYEAAAGGNQIKITSGFFGEELYLNRPINTILKGGYDSGFTTQGTATVMRSITVASGSAVVDNIILQ